MKFDVELYGHVELDEQTVRNRGLSDAIKEAFDEMRLHVDGVAYIPYTMDNEDLAQELDQGFNEDYSFDASRVIVLKPSTSNSEVKHALEKL
jgi:hypothetical protein